MADRIKGITIEIDGETKGLSKALQGVNKDIKTTQTQLKDINKLLKLDPHNVTLLGQKMSTLTKEINSTKDKLSQLKSVQDEMERGLKNGSISAEQYDTWQREIIETENELKNLQKELLNVPTASEAMLGKVSEHVESLGNKISSVGDKMSALGDKMSQTVTAPIVAGATASIAAWKEVDDAMDDIVKKTGATGENLEEFETIVNSIATTIPTDFKTAANAVGEVNTRFDVTGDILESLSTSFIKFADLNGTDVVGSIDTVSSMMKAWNLDANRTVEVLNLLNGVGQNTGVSVDTLANLMQDNALFFKEFNLDAAQTASLLGNMEKNGIDASAGVTAMRTAMAKATEDGKSLAEALTEYEYLVESAGVSEFDKLQAAKDLFGSKAYAQIYNALKEGNLSFTNIQGSMSDFRGNVEKTFSATLDPIDEFTTTMNDLKILGAEIGEEVLPILVDILKDLKPILDDIKTAWESMSEDEQRQLIENLGKLAAIGPALSISGRAITGIGNAIALLGKAGSKLSSLGLGAKLSSLLGSGVGAGATAGASVGASIVTGIGAGLAAATAGGAIGQLLDNYIIGPILDFFGSDDAKWYKDFSWFGDGGFFDELFDFNSLNEAIEVYKGAFAQMGADAKTNLNNMKEGASQIWDSMSTEAQGATAGAVATIASNWDEIKQKTTDTWDNVKTSVSDAWANVKGTFTDWKDGVFQTFEDIWSKIKGIWDSLGELFREGFDIKLPHFSVSGGVAPYGIGGQGSLPKFNIDWYANGGILTQPTIFGMQGGHFLGGGEAGAEAVLPLSNLQTMITQGMTEALASGGDTVINVSIDNNSLGSTILTAQQMMTLRRGK